MTLEGLFDKMGDERWPKKSSWQNPEQVACNVDLHIHKGIICAEKNKTTALNDKKVEVHINTSPIFSAFLRYSRLNYFPDCYSN